MDWTKLKALATEAGIVAGAAALTALASWAGSIDFGPWGPAVVALLTAAASAVRHLGPDTAAAAARTWAAERREWDD